MGQHAGNLYKKRFIVLESRNENCSSCASSNMCCGIVQREREREREIKDEIEIWELSWDASDLLIAICRPKWSLYATILMRSLNFQSGLKVEIFAKSFFFLHLEKLLLIIYAGFFCKIISNCSILLLTATCIIVIVVVKVKIISSGDLMHMEIVFERDDDFMNKLMIIMRSN